MGILEGETSVSTSQGSGRSDEKANYWMAQPPFSITAAIIAALVVFGMGLFNWVGKKKQFYYRERKGQGAKGEILCTSRRK